MFIYLFGFLLFLLGLMLHRHRGLLLVFINVPFLQLTYPEFKHNMTILKDQLLLLAHRLLRLFAINLNVKPDYFDALHKHPLDGSGKNFSRLLYAFYPAITGILIK